MVDLALQVFLSCTKTNLQSPLRQVNTYLAEVHLLFNGFEHLFLPHDEVVGIDYFRHGIGDLVLYHQIAHGRKLFRFISQSKHAQPVKQNPVEGH